MPAYTSTGGSHRRRDESAAEREPMKLVRDAAGVQRSPAASGQTTLPIPARVGQSSTRQLFFYDTVMSHPAGAPLTPNWLARNPVFSLQLDATPAGDKKNCVLDGNSINLLTSAAGTLSTITRPMVSSAHDDRQNLQSSSRCARGKRVERRPQKLGP